MHGPYAPLPCPPSDELPFHPAISDSVPSLPLEITDLIIDAVASQRAKNVRSNLAACSLVCRAWTRRSRSHFFKDCRLLLHYYNTARFGELLRSPHCTILPHVRRLTMESSGACIFDNIKEELKFLVRVESLKLSGSSWAAHGAPPRKGFMASLATVVELDIDCADLGDFDHAQLIICAFPALRRLSLPHIPMPYRVYGENSTLFEPYPPYTPPAWMRSREDLVRPAPLMSLTIAAPAMIPILHWLNWTGSCRLTRLELALPSKTGSHNTPPLVEFMYNARDSLEHLKLCSAAAHLDNIGEVFDLADFQNLRTLHFDHLLQQGNLGSLEGALVSIVRSITSPVLESVCFACDDHKLFNRIAWGELDDFFSGSEFPRLKLVRVSREWAHTAVEDANFTSEVKQLFPRVDARGLLQIQLPARPPTSLRLPKLEDVDAESLAYIAELIPL
ncbi:hypothetical protein B0H17DRAFT_1137586 [Mycena rosella]|uniref:F-box domain-containing protein n=1 Tax=Mycena rosella TaxID=1033263 RepID=A0AAD7D8Q7_MYCRO|nr:hypothetical protein B0H17DRAFT_1137586 [Mycena rosella]